MSLCDIPVRVISLSDESYKTALNKIEQAGHFKDVAIWNGVRGKDLFNEDMSLRRNYRQILQQKYPQVSIPLNISLLSPQAEKSLRYGQKSNVYDFHNAGAVGCALSHISLWQHIVEKNLLAMIIFEADVDFATKDGEFCEKLQSLLQNYKEDFDALNFNLLPIPFPWTDNTKLTQVGEVLHVNGIAFRMQGYLLTNEGAKKLLQNAFPLIYEVDSYMTLQTMLPSSNFKLIATKESWLNHPLVVFGSSIGYSPWQCLTDAVYFVPPSVLVILIGVLLLLIICMIIVGIYWLFKFATNTANARFAEKARLLKINQLI